MTNGNHRFRTQDTPLASYLVSEGFNLLIIEYTALPNRIHDRGTYVFDSSSDRFMDAVALYNRGAATINLAVYEHVRQGLLDRILKRQP